MKDDRFYLIYITECIDRIQQYTVDGKDYFLADAKTQDAVLRNLQILSESTQRLSPALKAAHPDVDWRRIAGFRNILVHDYLGINHLRVWDVIEQNLPDLQGKITMILQQLKETT
ncbi:MAG: DUF86 domain-containing protein [Chloroflexota bacterium]|nr:DUF86 domain-containing protein [Chloroflexota bacterium]